MLARPLGVAAVLTSVLLVAGCVTTRGTETAVDAGSYWIPADAVEAKNEMPAAFAAFDSTQHGSIAKIPQDVRGPMPAVVLLHGCRGIGAETRAQARIYADLGYAVFAPDSFAREGRRAVCMGQKGDLRFMRQQEARQVRERLHQVDWVDQNRVALVGHSEGGWAVGEYGGGDFDAAIITGWACNTGSYLPVADTTPVLAVNNAEDPWYGKGEARACNSAIAGHPASRSIVFERKGHAVSDHPQFRAIVEDFLADALGQPDVTRR